MKRPDDAKTTTADAQAALACLAVDVRTLADAYPALAARLRPIARELASLSDGNGRTLH